MKKTIALLLLCLAGSASASTDASKHKDPCEECKKTVAQIFNQCYAAAKTPDDVQACLAQYETMGKSCIAVQCKGKTDLAPAPVPKASPKK